MTLGEFFDKYEGKYVDFDGEWGAQCVDIVRQYIKEVLEFPQPPPVIGAADLWESYLADFFEQVPNTPTGVPKAGDIIIWNRKLGNGYGHVAIASGTGNTAGFTSFDQNYPLGTPCHFQDHNYSSVTGWLHPKENMNEALEVCMKDREKFWKERDEALARLSVCEEECRKQSDQCASEKKTLEEKLAGVEVQLEALAKTNEALIKKIERLEAEIEALKSDNPLDGYSGIELIVAGIKKLIPGAK